MKQNGEQKEEIKWEEPNEIKEDNTQKEEIKEENNIPIEKEIIKEKKP